MVLAALKPKLAVIGVSVSKEWVCLSIPDAFILGQEQQPVGGTKSLGTNMTWDSRAQQMEPLFSYPPCI